MDGNARSHPLENEISKPPAGEKVVKNSPSPHYALFDHKSSSAAHNEAR